MATDLTGANRARLRVDDPDGAIVARILEGEADLYEVLIRRHNQRIYRVARAFLRDDGEVEDVMQEAYLRAYAGLPRFQGRALFSTWLTRIVINCASSRIRNRVRRGEVEIDSLDERESSGVGVPAPEEGGEQNVMREQVGRLLEKAIEELPANYRIVFVMRELEKASVAETAACLRISPSNVKVRLHRAKRSLRQSLSREVPDIALYAFDGDHCDRVARRVMGALGENAPGRGSTIAPSGLSHSEIIDELSAVVGPYQKREKADC
jgi:RNA polymerase sigma-70 factor (ECF subfamily)